MKYISSTQAQARYGYHPKTLALRGGWGKD